MGGKQDGFSFLPQGQKDFDQLLPRNRVQAAGGLVQQQQFRPVGQGQRQGVLDFHAVGKLGGRFFLLQAEKPHVPAVRFIAPGRVKGAGNGGDGPEPFGGVIAHPGGNKADVLLDLGGAVRHGQPAEGDLSFIRLHEAEDGMEGGGFPRAVAADKAGNFSGRQIKGNIPKLKGWIPLAKPPHRQGKIIFHHD